MASEPTRSGRSEAAPPVPLTRNLPCPHRPVTSRPSSRDIVRRVEKAFNDRDLNAIEEVVADHLLDRSEFLGGTDFRVRLGRILEAFPDAHVTVDDVIHAGSVLAARWTVTGTHRGTFLGFPATGRKVTTSGISLAIVHKGKVVEYWGFPDLQSVAGQLEKAA
jgi:steroid delta-isomerase-like uncharacterized protein